MRDQIEALEELQQIDSELRQIESDLRKYPNEISEYESELQLSKDTINDKKAQLEEVEEAKKQLEQKLEHNEETVKKAEKRLFEIKTHKEYEALQKEIAETKKSNMDIEEELLLKMDQIEKLEAEIKEEESTLESKESEYREKINEYHKIIDDLKAKHEPKKKEKEQAASKISNNILSVYQKIRNKNGSALAEVTNEICTGCNMNIPPQLYNEVLTQNKLIQCPNCKKILYANPKESEKTE